MGNNIPTVVPINLPEGELIDDPPLVMPKFYKGFGATPKRIRGLIRLAMTVALMQCVDQGRDAMHAIRLLTAALRDITPQYNTAQRYQLASRWIAYAVVGNGKRTKEDV